MSAQQEHHLHAAMGFFCKAPRAAAAAAAAVADEATWTACACLPKHTTQVDPQHKEVSSFPCLL